MRAFFCFVFGVPSIVDRLEQTGDVTSLWVQVDIVESRTSGKTGHGGHVSDQGVDKVGSRRQPDLVDGQGEAGRDTLLGRVIGQGQSGLGHTDGKVTEPCVANRPVSKDTYTSLFSAQKETDLDGCKSRSVSWPPR
jgi:hypothetical protein